MTDRPPEPPAPPAPVTDRRAAGNLPAAVALAWSLGPTARRTLVTVGVTAAVVVLLLFLWYARHVLLLAFGGALLAVFLRSMAIWVGDRTRLRPAISLALVVIAITGALVAAFWLAGPDIAEQGRVLRERLPVAFEQLQRRMAGYELGRQIMEDAPNADDLIPGEGGAMSRATSAVGATLRGLASIGIVLFLALVFAATPKVYVSGVLALFPRRHVPRVNEVLEKLERTLLWWLIGRIISMTVVGVSTGIGLALLGVPLAFLLGLIAALLTFIPNIGPVLSAVPAILIAFVESPRLALYVTLLYIGVQTIESFIIEPIIDRKTVYLPPAIVIVAQLIMAVFAGIAGVALATPLTAVIVVLTTMVYVQDVLGRDEIEVKTR